jgi:hypothetical protein
VNSYLRGLWPAALFAALACPGAARAQEMYFLMVFGSQQTPPRPKYSHSFATFVKATPAADGKRWALEAHTISWLPADLEIRTWALLPEPGRNFDLPATLNWVYGTEQRLSMWGPYRIDPDLYHRALRQIGVLSSGRVLYKAIDTGYSTDGVSNCIHAVSTITGGSRLRVTVFGYGEVASQAILGRLEPWVLDRCVTHDWVAASLGLTRYPIIRRDYEPLTGLLR